MYTIAQYETARLNENADDEDEMTWTGSIRRMALGIYAIFLPAKQMGTAQQISSATQAQSPSTQKAPDQPGSANPETLTTLFRETAVTQWLAEHRVYA